jgi:hypothetical protein
MQPQWGERIEGAALSISANAARYGPAEPIDLELSLGNFGATPLAIIRQSPWVDYLLTITREGSDQVAPTSYAERIREAALEGRCATSYLTPGEILSESLKLDRAYDMRASGNYRIFATRGVFLGRSPGEFITLLSNSLTIQIVERVR